MLAVVGQPSLDALVDAAVPAASVRSGPCASTRPRPRPRSSASCAGLANLNSVMRSMIGLGYYGTLTPPVVQRNVLENPAWYTAYTPYQPEISQGRLEALLNFQTVVSDLTGLSIAGASLLDESTAVAEAMTLMRRTTRSTADAVLVVDEHTLPQSVAVTRTRALPLGIDVVVADLDRRSDSADGAAGRGGRPRRVRGRRAVPRRRRRAARLPRPHRSRARARRPRHRGRRPARAHPRHRAGGVGRRHRRRQHPALRRADGLRRAARRLHVGAPRPGAVDARPPRRGVGRQRRPPRLPAGSADPRAAHPPREGDLQHLHGAGPARRHGQHVCRVARARRTRRHRAAHPRLRPGAGRGPAGRRRRRGHRGVLRHRHRAGPRPGGRHPRRGRRPGRQPVAGRRRHRSR